MREAELERQIRVADEERRTLESKSAANAKARIAVLKDVRKEAEEKRTGVSKEISSTRTAMLQASAEVVRAENAREGVQAETSLATRLSAAAIQGNDDPESCRALRNFLQDEILTRSHQMCRQHLADTQATASLINTDFGMGSIIFSTLGAVTGGIQAKANLSGLAAGTNATQTLINKEVYRDVVVPAITKAINTDRDRKLQEIIADQTKDVLSYSVSRAVVEANDFHERCSFAHGLLLIATDAEKRTPPRIEELESQVKKNYEQIKSAEDSLTDKSSDRDKELVQKTVERLRVDIDAILVRINLMKRTQNPT